MHESMRTREKNDAEERKGKYQETTLTGLVIFNLALRL